MADPPRPEDRVRAARPRRDPEFNWVWLVDVPDRRALEVLDERHGPDRRMGVLFDRIDRCRPGPGAFALEAGDGTVDVVVLHDLLPALARRVTTGSGADGRDPLPPEVVVLSECRRVLRDGGVVQLILDNALWHRNLRRSLDPRDSGRDPGCAARPGTVREWIDRAGFGGARVYYLSPRSGFPEGLIPSSGAALDAHERLRGTASGLRRVARRLLARSGMGSVLHPRFLVLGLV